MIYKQESGFLHKDRTLSWDTYISIHFENILCELADSAVQRVLKRKRVKWTCWRIECTVLGQDINTKGKARYVTPSPQLSLSLPQRVQLVYSIPQ